MIAKTAGYLTTIGLEVHVELGTKTKLFCGCPVAFGGEPNSRVCPVCLGHPGTLPVANEVAIEYATKIAIALGCEVAPHSIFHRKNYFYPDMPKNYQISQYDIPIGSRGLLEIEFEGEVRPIRITRVHLEEDTGKTSHVGGGGRIHEADHSLIDFNRAGTPLVEIVTEPDIRSPEEARVFASELRSILEFLGVSDVRMEEGSLRVDANISVSSGAVAGVKSEVKNMNSLRSLGRALAYEQERQRKILENGGSLEQSTRHWDEKAGVTSAMRTKEYAFDYRYLPEPDLVPIEPSVEWLRQLSEEIPELPAERRRRFEQDLGLGAKAAATLTSSRAGAEFFEHAAAASKSADAKQVGNWVVNELSGLLSERGEELASSKVTPAGFAGLLDLVAEGSISNVQAKEVLGEMLDSGRAAGEIVAERGIEQVSDRGALEQIVEEVISSNAEMAERFRAGEEKVLGPLVGAAMKATGGQGNPALIREILLEKLG